MNDRAAQPALLQPTTTSRTRHNAEHNRSLGARGEAIAAEYLERMGCRVLCRNWRHKRVGEIDLIVQDHEAIVAVEVKTRGGTEYGHPLEAITVAKSRRLRRLVFAWIKESNTRAAQVRVDAVGIVLRTGEEPRIHHLRGIA